MHLKHHESYFGVRYRIVTALATMAMHGGFKQLNDGPIKALPAHQFTNVQPMNLILWAVLEGYMSNVRHFDAYWIELADLFSGHQTDTFSTEAYTEQ